MLNWLELIKHDCEIIELQINNYNLEWNMRDEEAHGCVQASTLEIATQARMSKKKMGAVVHWSQANT